MIDYENVISFESLKAKYQKWKLDTMYYWYLLSCDLGIFKYNGLPESMDPIYMELFLNRSGNTGIKNLGRRKYLVGYASRDGELNQYGLGEECFCTAINGDGFTGVVGKDCTIIYNNPLKTPEIDVLIDAVAMADCQQSAGINVKFARIAPVFKTKNGTQSAAIDSVLNTILDGNLKTIISKNELIDEALDPVDNSGFETIDVTQPERIQYVQYLSRYQDDIMRRHFSRRGLSMRTPTKAAQQSDSEINGMDSVSWYYLLQKLDERKKGIENFNQVNDEHASVEFSEIWKNEYEAYLIRQLKKDEEREGDLNEDQRQRTKEGVSDPDTDRSSVSE